MAFVDNSGFIIGDSQALPSEYSIVGSKDVLQWILRKYVFLSR